MKIKAPARILAVAGLCLAALIGLVINEALARASGQEVLLPIEAVDPRSLLHGHYVQLDLTQRLAQGEQCPPQGDWKWVALQPRGDVHVLAGGADSRNAAQGLGALPIKGSFTCQDPFILGEGEAQPGWVRLDLGIDRFHINQQDAERIERVLRDQRPDDEIRAYAIVSVARDGHARLRGLIVDGERLELNWL
jgi:uncharacterized membrane-anchored protein